MAFEKWLILLVDLRFPISEGKERELNSQKAMENGIANKIKSNKEKVFCLKGKQEHMTKFLTSLQYIKVKKYSGYFIQSLKTTCAPVQIG